MPINTSFTYDSSAPGSADIHRVRLVLGDSRSGEGQGCRPDGSNFSDEEIQMFITDQGDWRLAVPPMLRVLAHEYTQQANRVLAGTFAGDVKLENSDTLGRMAKETAAAFMNAAKAWEERMAYDDDNWANWFSYADTDSGGNDNEPYWTFARWRDELAGPELGDAA